jgi:hypothetical protein
MVRPANGMKLFPRSCDDWTRLFFASFRAYVLLAFLGELWVEASLPFRAGSFHSDCMIFILLGYIVSFLVFVAGALVSHDRKAALLHAISAFITFAIGFYSLRYLAST